MLNQIFQIAQKSQFLTWLCWHLACEGTTITARWGVRAQDLHVVFTNTAGKGVCFIIAECGWGPGSLLALANTTQVRVAGQVALLPPREG
jgi:hypothetical protein